MDSWMDQNQMEQEEGITLGELLQMIRKHIVSAIVVCVVVFAAVAAYTFLAPKKYEATAELLAMSGQGAISDNANASQYSSIGSYINTQIATYPQLVKTEAVLEPVIDDLGLDTTVAETAELITASNPDGTFMVDITAETEDPALSQQLANAVADSLSEQVSTSMNTVTKDQAPVSLSVVQQAALPEGPSSPNVPLYLAAGLVVGVILGIGFAIVREMLNTRIDTTSDVRGILGSSAIGSIPDDQILLKQQPVVVAQPGGPIAEEYRRIRTNISFLKTDRVAGEGQLIVISSVSPVGRQDHHRRERGRRSGRGRCQGAAHRRRPTPPVSRQASRYRGSCRPCPCALRSDDPEGRGPELLEAKPAHPARRQAPGECQHPA